MAAATPVLRLPPPVQIAQTVAKIAPADLSKSPLLGILGVIIGAGTVTLTGRMITLGLADLKGHLGISFDAGAWIGTSYNMALMFIGPFTVYLGGLIGPRRILFFSATAFTVICALLPFVHNYTLLVAAIALAGLTSGTFYPLTLTFALRNIPLRFLPFTVALYATFVDGAVNVAPTLYGWYRDHLSWHWMFWNSAVITPVMMLCIYYGIPPSPTPKRSSETPSFAGFLYASAGLAMLLGAFEQGERLDWWRSGVFTALFVGGSFLIMCSLVRRLRSPNPLVDMPYLRQWNTVLLGIGLFLFRFCLVTTIILVPQSLAIHGFEADQIGPAVIWSAVPLLLIAFVAALLLLADLDSRLLMASGFAFMALTCYLNAGITSAWSASNYYRTELVMGVGQAFAFIGLVSTIILQGIFSGGLSKPQWILTFSAFFHTVRLFGGNVGAVAMGHFISYQQKLHSNLLGLHVGRGNWITDGNIQGLTAGLFSHSAGLATATGRAVGIISSRLRLQAYTLSIIDGFYLVAWACVIALLLVALLRSSPLNYADLSATQQTLAAEKESKKMKRKALVFLMGTAVSACLALAAEGGDPAPSRHITLQEAVQLALKHNHNIRIAGYAVDEKEHVKEAAKSSYFPSIRNDSSFMRLTETQLIELSSGSLGVAGRTPIPAVSSIINQGGRNLVTSGTQITQPLTSLLKIKQANDVAQAEVKASREKAQLTENDVALNVHEVYYRILIAQALRSATEARIKASQELQNERLEQVKFGSSLEQDAIESRAQLLQAKQELLTTDLQLSDLKLKLNDLMGLPLTTALDLDPTVVEFQETCMREECVKAAMDSHPEIREARAELEKAEAAVRLAKTDIWVPDIEAFARYSYQDNVPFLARNFGTFGIHFGYDLFDGGRKRAVLHEHEAQLSQAKENLAKLTDEVELAVETAYNKLERTQQMLEVSEEVLALRSESNRVLQQELSQGAALKSQAAMSTAQEYEAKALLLQSQMDYSQAHDEFIHAMGRTPE